jgi:glucosamine--fructose-6-phosphate aminotransferase (isomerizing)
MSSDPMIEDIKRQPDRLNLLLENYFNNETYNNKLKKAVQLIENTNKPILFAGMGSSNYASISAINILSEKEYLCVRPNIDEFIHYQMDSFKSGHTIIATSQSGKSIETKKLVKKLHVKNNIIAITNNENSPLAKLADISLPIFAGKEATISTKTFTNSNYLLNIIAYLVNNNQIDIATHKLEIDTINNLIKESEDKITDLYNHIKQKSKWSFISRGDLLSSTMMGALICAEGTGLQPMGYTGGTFRHGPLEITGEDHGAVIMAKDDKTYDLLIKLTEEISGNNSNIILITNKNYKPNNPNIMVYKLDEVNRLLQPTQFSIVMQFLTRITAQDRNRTPGILNKISKVTEEE